MCREDIAIGKAREAQQQVTAIGSTNAILKPDGRRVALLVSLTAVTTFDSTGAVFSTDSAWLIPGGDSGGTPILACNNGNLVAVLRIEDLGNLITGSFSVVVGNTTGQARAALTPIILNANIGTFKDGNYQ